MWMMEYFEFWTTIEVWSLWNHGNLYRDFDSFYGSTLMLVTESGWQNVCLQQDCFLNRSLIEVNTNDDFVGVCFIWSIPHWQNSSNISQLACSVEGLCPAHVCLWATESSYPIGRAIIFDRTGENVKFVVTAHVVPFHAKTEFRIEFKCDHSFKKLADH